MLPYGFCLLAYHEKTNLRRFGRFGITKDSSKARQSTQGNNSTYVIAVSDYQTLFNVPGLQMTTLEMKLFKGRRYITLTQEFPAEMSGTYIKRIPGFYYKWDDDTVTIYKNIATLNPNKIQKQTEELMRECNRFFLMYCN